MTTTPVFDLELIEADAAWLTCFGPVCNDEPIGTTWSMALDLSALD